MATPLPVEEAAAPSVFAFCWEVRRLVGLDALSVRFHLAVPGRVRIELRALNGGAKVLFDAPRAAGEFREIWRLVDAGGRVLDPGVYLVGLALDGEDAAEQALVLA